MEDLFNLNDNFRFSEEKPKQKIINKKFKYKIFSNDEILNRGKHKGKHISEIPSYYLAYMLKEWDLTDNEIDLIESNI